MRKLMRPERNFCYVIDRLVSEISPVFAFMQKHGEVDLKEAYETWNMGPGFAFYVAGYAVKIVNETARSLGLYAWHGGYIEASRQKSVVIKPADITWTEKDLNI